MREFLVFYTFSRLLTSIFLALRNDDFILEILNVLFNSLYLVDIVSTRA
jgi:hypothetical protein